jgi:periplasmic divalent cation tolerance protein
MTGFVTVLTTTATEDEAETIAEALLAEALAACVQIMAIRSRYVWKGEVAREAEQLLLIKTREDLFEPVRARIRTLHSYDTPEIVALPISAGDVDYLGWLGETTRRA